MLLYSVLLCNDPCRLPVMLLPAPSTTPTTLLMITPDPYDHSRPSDYDLRGLGDHHSIIAQYYSIPTVSVRNGEAVVLACECSLLIDLHVTGPHHLPDQASITSFNNQKSTRKSNSIRRMCLQSHSVQCESSLLGTDGVDITASCAAITIAMFITSPTHACHVLERLKSTCMRIKQLCMYINVLTPPGTFSTCWPSP